MIEIENLTKIYNGTGKKAVDNLSLTVEDGEIFGFLGPNGAGKSTTIKCLTGILKFNQGHIRVNGADIQEDPVGAKSKIGFVPDEHYLYEGLTGRQYVNFVLDIFGVPDDVRKERIEKYAGLFGMKEHLDEPSSSYSHGMKQKISLVSAFSHEPEVLVLDEPMMGLDPASSYELKTLMREWASAGRIVFFSSHVLDVVEKICTKVAIIDNGKLATVCDMRELKEKRKDLSLEQLFLTLTRSEVDGE